MKKARAETSRASSRKIRPALSPEARENQLISLAIDLAEKQLIEGTATSQVITHYLKLGSTKERLEKEILEEQKKLVSAKTKALNESEDLKEIYKEAIDAMKIYRGQRGSDED